ncbi:MAG: type II toxin-antitoxin system Phd/YefM family antitoxin [Terracidiphilus sp.]
MVLIEANEFEAKCLELLEQVQTTREPVIVTKSGRPVARLVPMQRTVEICGALKGSVLYEGDIISPLDVEWEANKD